MVLTKTELIASLQHEVRILLHLIEKIDPDTRDYRPTPKQRSTEELVRYLSMMGPTIVRYGLADPPDVAIWTRADEAATARSFEECVAEIGAQGALYDSLLAPVSDATFREDFTDFDGNRTSRGAFIVNLVLTGCAAYRTQLFLYLKLCGQEQLNSSNLWMGVDAQPA
jgi:hypothetical protein